MARILLVDDDPATLDVIDFALQLEGHETFTAVNGRAGVERALELRPTSSCSTR
ncbi:MAG: hypothetical protein KY457_10065 [Actinobacteria bacterium]|nr:hypothetical protein [Actinomycetota bacterium]